MTKPQSIASFVLRFSRELWQDTQGEPHVQWRGHIRHVQGDEEERFTDFSEAITFIQHYLMQLTLDAFPDRDNATQEKVFHEGFKIWEQLASTYTDMMFEAINRTVKQSKAVKKQMDVATEQALKVWQAPIQTEAERSNQQQMLEILYNLQQQVQALAGKVDRLEEAIQKETSLHGRESTQ